MSDAVALTATSCAGAARRGSATCPNLPTDHLEDPVEPHWTTQGLPADFTTRVRATMHALLDETTGSKRLPNDHFASELPTIDRQEENLLGLVADTAPAVDSAPATTKIRARFALATETAPDPSKND